MFHKLKNECQDDLEHCLGEMESAIGEEEMLAIKEEMDDRVDDHIESIRQAADEKELDSILDDEGKRLIK